MHARRALAAAFAVTLALAACGGDDDGGSDTTTTTAADETTTTGAESTTTTEDDATTTTEAPAGDDPEAVAAAVNLTSDDFTSDWTSEPQSDEDDDLDVTLCFVDSDLAGNTLAEADSDGFSQETEDQVIQVGSTGIVTSGVGVASTVLGEATRSAFQQCVLDQFEAALSDSGITILESSLSYAPGVTTAAEQVVALNGAITAEDDTTTYDIEVSMWLHRQGAVIAGVSVLDIGDTDFATVVDSTNAIVGERLVEVVG
jgi:hypothetical protein